MIELYKKILVIIFSLIFSIVVVTVIDNLEKSQLLLYPIPNGISMVSPNITEYKLNIALNPGYFSSLGKVYAYYYSPYADYIKIFEINASLDDDYWKNVPINSTLPDEERLIYIGSGEINKPKMTIYIKSFIPPQTLLANIPKEDVLNSFHGYIMIKREHTMHDNVIYVLVIISLFGATFSILNSLTPFMKIARKNDEDILIGG